MANVAIPILCLYLLMILATEIYIPMGILRKKKMPLTNWPLKGYGLLSGIQQTLCAHQAEQLY